MKYAFYSFLLAMGAMIMAGSMAQAQILRLSPLVHNAPAGGYAFQALAPLPAVMPDQVQGTRPVLYTRTSNSTFGNSVSMPAVYTPAPTTTVDLKKKL
jgi:hypothetical protein